MRTGPGGIFYFPWNRHQIVEGTDGFYCLLRKTLARRGKRNCQSSEAKLSAVGFERVPHRPAASASQCSNPLGTASPPVTIKSVTEIVSVTALCLCSGLRSGGGGGMTISYKGPFKCYVMLFSWNLDPHPPPRNANNIEPYTFVTLFLGKIDTPHPYLRYVTLEWPLRPTTAISVQTTANHHQNLGIYYRGDQTSTETDRYDYKTNHRKPSQTTTNHRK